MTQPGPAPEQMRVAANHGSFVAVQAESVAAFLDRLASLIVDLGGQLGAPRPDRWAAFRQSPAPLRQLAVFPPAGGWTLVVPASNDEELLGLLARRLSATREAVAVTWHPATGYQAVSHFRDAALMRHVAIYSGELQRELGERFPTERYDAEDLADLLMEAPKALSRWLKGRGIDPVGDRTRAGDGGDPLQLYPVSRGLDRRAIVDLYLAEVDPTHPELLEERQR